MIYIGVDGGGTKTKVYLYEDNQFVSESTVGPSSINRANIQSSLANIKEGINQCYELSNVTLPIDSIFLGLTGNPTRENTAHFKKEFTHEKINNNTLVIIDNDMSNAFEAASNGRPSIALIIGTGSVGFGRDEDNNSHRVSGVHYFEGDYGSGYNIGLQSLKAMSKAFDGRLIHTPFTLFIQKKYSFSSYCFRLFLPALALLYIF